MKLLNWLSQWTIIKRNDYENIINEFADISANLDALHQDNQDLGRANDTLSQRNVELSIKLGNLTREVDVNDSKFWNNKWIKSKIYYKAPKRKHVIQYVKEYPFPSVTTIALEIIRAYRLNRDDCDSVALAVMKWIKDNKFKYANEKVETWKCPEQILDDKNVGNDCDDIGILEYYIIREIFKELNVWEKVKHRLKCVCGNVNHRGSIPFGAGGHFYLTWLHSDGHWYVVESTYYIATAIANYGKLPQKYNSMYGTIWFTFNDEHSWAQKSITVTKKSFIKNDNNI
jgi:hypothetical protein